MSILLVVLILLGVVGLVKNILRIIYDIIEFKHIQKTLEQIGKKYDKEMEDISKRYNEC